MLENYKNIFFLGIKGVAMTNLAVILKKIGKKVSGYDVEEEFLTDELLKKNKIKWQIDKYRLPKDIDLFVYSAAHQGVNNYLSQIALKEKIPTITQPELINKLMLSFKNKIAVCGSHGKTTISSLLSYSLIKLKQKPSYLVGAPSFNNFNGGDYNDKKDYFIVEADEYAVNPPFDKRIKFNFLNPDWIICSNIDFDHPDVYKNLNYVKKVFFNFFKKGKLVLNIDDKNLLAYFNQHKNKSKILTFGFNHKAEFNIVDYKIEESGSSFKIARLGNFKIALYGIHNILNATAVIAILVNLGFSSQKIKEAIADFRGAKRRFELIYKNSFILFDDYAHHPQEIRAVLNTAKKIFQERRILAIFQPHTFSRTKVLLKDFIESLRIADKVFILPIFASARENPSEFRISSYDLIKGNKNKFKYVKDKFNLLNNLKKELKKGDVVFTLGAGDIYKVGEEIVINFNKIN